MSEIEPDVRIYKSEILNTKILGIHISADPRFKLIEKSNELGLQGKRVLGITEWSRIETSDKNNTFNEVLDYYFKTEDVNPL